MSIRRVVPDIASTDFAPSRAFYTELLGFDVAMEMDEVLTFASPSNPTAQVTLMKPGMADLDPDMSIEVGDVDAVYAQAQRRGEKIVYPLTDEPWGVRRFFVRDPNGKIINVLTHIE